MRNTWSCPAVDVSCLGLSFPIGTARVLDPMTLLVSGAWAVQGWPKGSCAVGGGGQAQKGRSGVGLMSPPCGRSWEDTYMDGQRWEEEVERAQAQGNPAGDAQQMPTKVTSRGRTVPWGASARSRARSGAPHWHLLKGPSSQPSPYYISHVVPACSPDNP